MNSDTNALAAEVLDLARARGMMIATAESCTGGLIAGALTDIAGSSDVVDRGFITYSNEAKQDMLGVRAETLAAHGAVSAQTAVEMAAGALARSRATLAIAVAPAKAVSAMNLPHTVLSGSSVGTASTPMARSQAAKKSAITASPPMRSITVRWTPPGLMMTPGALM